MKGSVATGKKKRSALESGHGEEIMDDIDKDARVDEEDASDGGKDSSKSIEQCECFFELSSRNV